MPRKIISEGVVDTVQSVRHRAKKNIDHELTTKKVQSVTNLDTNEPQLFSQEDDIKVIGRMVVAGYNDRHKAIKW